MIWKVLFELESERGCVQLLREDELINVDAEPDDDVIDRGWFRFGIELGLNQDSAKFAGPDEKIIRPADIGIQSSGGVNCARGGEPWNWSRANAKASMLDISRWVVGSSIKSRLGGSSRSFTRARRLFSPPLSTSTFLKTSSPRNRNAKAVRGE